jgi:DNA-binding MarR family transcriptional regulator
MQPLNTLQLFEKTVDLYDIVCQPLCDELNLPRVSFDILMFLANNPQYFTASDITRYRGLKRNQVSMHVESLVRGGYLERQSIPGDRRQKRLVCTAAAQEIIRKGHAVQHNFQKMLLEGLSPAQREQLEQTITVIDRNITSHREALRRANKG